MGEKLQQDFAETHISWVIFTDNYALKIKRPVILPFLDFSSKDQRLGYCLREITLNRRLTEIYLGISFIEQRGSFWHFSSIINHPQEPGLTATLQAEPAVVMRRIDEQYRMDHLVEKGQLNSGQIGELAKQVAEFHRRCPIRDAEHLPEIWRNHWKEFNELLKRASEKGLADQTHSLQILNGDLNSLLKRLTGIIRSRAKKGLIRDLHGDLHAANVFFNPAPVIFDCIEFNDHFRWIDLMDEVAMLYSDLMRLNNPQLARQFLKAYELYNAEVIDTQDSVLFSYYCAYRLSIRSKVLIIKILNSKLSHESYQNHKNELNLFLRKLSEFTEKVNRSG